MPVPIPISDGFGAVYGEMALALLVPCPMDTLYGLKSSESKVAGKLRF
jgi:hypothetical protein